MPRALYEKYHMRDQNSKCPPPLQSIQENLNPLALHISI